MRAHAAEGGYEFSIPFSRDAGEIVCMRRDMHNLAWELLLSIARNEGGAARVLAHFPVYPVQIRRSQGENHDTTRSRKLAADIGVFTGQYPWGYRPLVA